MAMQDDIWGFSPASKPDMLADLSNRQTASNSTQLLNGENSHKPVIGSIKVPKENGTQSLNVLLNAMKFNEKTVTI